jgi:hypothetical protein
MGDEQMEAISHVMDLRETVKHIVRIDEISGAAMILFRRRSLPTGLVVEIFASGLASYVLERVRFRSRHVVGIDIVYEILLEAFKKRITELDIQETRIETTKKRRV